MPTAAPVMVKDAVVPPAGIATELGMVTIPDGVALSPALIALATGTFKVTWPVIWLLTPTLGESRVMVVVGATTFTVAVPDVKPDADPVIVVVPAAIGLTVILTEEAFAGTVTLAGTVATPVLLLVKVRPWPVGPAGLARVTVSVPEPVVATASGLGVRVMTFGVVAVMVTVAAGLLI